VLRFLPPVFSNRCLLADGQARSRRSFLFTVSCVRPKLSLLLRLHFSFSGLVCAARAPSGPLALTYPGLATISARSCVRFPGLRSAIFLCLGFSPRSQELALVAPAGCFCLERAPPFCRACFLRRLISLLPPLNFVAPALGFRTGPRFSGLGAAVRALLFPM
jgi:hypothetical protein